jgi:AcrR family transcriptional regulator
VRTRPRQRLDRRDDLLARVVDIFLSNGFSSVTISALAQQLRCSKVTLYRVAPAKEQLAQRSSS